MSKDAAREKKEERRLRKRKLCLWAGGILLGIGLLGVIVGAALFIREAVMSPVVGPGVDPDAKSAAIGRAGTPAVFGGMFSIFGAVLLWAGRVRHGRGEFSAADGSRPRR